MASLLTKENRPVGLLLAIAIGIPLALSGDRFAGYVIGMTAIYILWSAGMNLLYGYTGLLSLMFGGIAGISAYTMIWMWQHWGWSFWLATPTAVVFAAVVGVALGLPALRLRGFYFALASLVIQTVVTLAFVYFSHFTNGDTGISGIAAPNIPFSHSAHLQGVWFTLFLTIVAWLGVCSIALIERSKFGKTLVAIREDDLLAESIGINVVRGKLLAFFWSSIFAALSGALYATYVGFISPSGFDILVSTNIWLMVAFGGRGTVLGPVLGAAILTPLPFVLLQLSDFKDVIFGGLLVIVMLVMPSGLYGVVARYSLHRSTSLAKGGLRDISKND